jgi:BASS family bile acid:Na+ symporter
MFGMGLSLQISDFVRLAKMPKAIFVGLFGQMLLLPALAFAVAVYFKVDEDIAIGLMILAACPGGTSSNLFTHIARANLALSISLTAINTIICVVTTPLIISFAIDYFSTGEPAQFSLIGTSLGLILITLVPVSIGMFVRAKFVELAAKLEPIFRHASILFMVLIIGKIIYDESDLIIEAWPDMYILTVGLNLFASALGIFLAKLFMLNDQDGVTLGIEIGTQNGTLAILIALTFIEVPAYAIVAGVYGVAMYLGAVLVVAYGKTLPKTKPS